MIVTILLILKKILEFAKRHRINRESLIIDLIESSSTSCDSLNDSMIVFLNCKSVIMNDIQCSSKNSQENVFFSSSSRRKKNSNKRLNSIKKMDCEEDGNRDLLNGLMAGLKGNLISPPSDCNSNNLTMPKENMFLYSTDSIHDCNEFLQDNSDYQWCLDYGYKDNNYSHHQSILSMSRSQDLFYYDDMARNIDANLAEVDMDDFNREDIHSVLSTLPNMQGAEEREMFASVTGSMIVKFGLDTSISPHANSQEEQNCTSICKSQLLFSPVRDSYLPNANLSVDSLDLSENDINLMVTCQANKNNYTIAFEGSTVMASDDSETRETGCSGESTSVENEITQYHEELKKKQTAQHFTPSGNVMARSDSTFTTWSKIKENSSENLQLRRHPSGNNNTNVDSNQSSNVLNSSGAVKSLSLPNLFRQRQRQNSGMSVSVKLSSGSESSSIDGEQRRVKLYDVQNTNSKSVDHSGFSASGKPPHNFSLVKLFIKQKSASHEGMSNYMAEQIPLKENFSETKTEIKDDSDLNVTQAVQQITQINQKNTFQASNEKKGNNNSYNCSRDKYCSDESTQENGSNTESAENLTCHCINHRSDLEKKKIVTEKCIQTSKCLESGEVAQKLQKKVPVYILYPNYSLPNLEFLKKEHYIQNIDFSKVFLRPQKFKMPQSPAATPKTTPKTQGKRPFSVNDIESLKKTGFKHVKDWESLTFLLPTEYKQFLQEIPEIVAQLKDVKNAKEELVPLFCLSPPPNRRIKKRPTSCDVNFFNNDFRSSNFSSTATQPSSGYRGSSTMLNSNNSNSTNSPRIPSYGYKNDSSSESGSSRRSGSYPHNKNYFNYQTDNPPPRPPLPRSILRNNSLDNQQYTCKTQKENANKRYSMIELGEKQGAYEDKQNRRRSGPSFQAYLNRTNEQKQNESNKSSKGSRSSESEENYFDGETNLENDMRRLEELLEISAIFGESVESFTENDMLRLRSQVSKFLTMQKNLERVSETLQTVDEGTVYENTQKNEDTFENDNSLNVAHQHTPHNTPEHKKQAIDHKKSLGEEGYCKPCDCNGRVHEFEDEDCKFREDNMGGLKKTVSFAEKIAFAVKEQESKAKEKTPPTSPGLLLTKPKRQIKSKRPVDLPICEESAEGMSNESPSRNVFKNSAVLSHKRDLILDVRNAVKKILQLPEGKPEEPANACLHHLCPSLYAVLSDGLKEEIDTPFGPIRNSVWSVVEASSQQGPMTQTLNELVQRLNRDDIFTEGLIKFNAFIFGLLNARALAGWFSYLRTRDSLLRKYYDNSGLLLMSNTAGAPVRILIDQLISILEPLCSVQFNLDLMYQTKLLHCSLQNLNCLLEQESGNNDFLTPTKQFMLLKLVQSIQNSLSQSGEGKRSKQTIEDIDQKTSDPPVGHLLEKNKSLRSRRGPTKARPRSGCDTLGAGQSITDVASAMKKRWSGVNLNSKLVEAFDRLGDDSESDYTDSLDNAKPRRGQDRALSYKNVSRKNSEPNSRTADTEADLYTKEQKRNILLNLNKKSCGKVEERKTELEDSNESMDESVSQIQNGEHKFKRLQQKWERLSGRSASDSDSDVKSPPVDSTHSRKAKSATSRTQTFEKTSCDTNITTPSPTSKVSKIPRLVTSPLSSTPSTKPTGNVKKLPSPTSYAHTNTNQRGKISSNSAIRESKSATAIGSRLSRCDEKSEGVNSVPGKTHPVRPTSLPYRGSSTLPAKKTEPVSRRAASMSLNRKPAVKKLQQVPRTVRTLTHRLPSDSGHLSFNEGEKLKVVLEVDKTWLLCCRGTQKGLVPKSAVISDIEDNKF